VRSGMADDHFRVLISPRMSGGLPLSEITIAEALKSNGYATGTTCAVIRKPNEYLSNNCVCLCVDVCFEGMAGKWHLGINMEDSNDGSHLPTAQGYDSYLGNIQPYVRTARDLISASCSLTTMATDTSIRISIE